MDLYATPDSLPDIYKKASIAYLQQKNNEKFRIYLDAFLNYYVKKHDLDNPDVAKYYIDVADVYFLQRDYLKALDYRIKALHIRIKALGENNPLLADDYMKMSDLYILLNDNNQANTFAVMAQVILEQENALISNDADNQETMIKEKRDILNLENGIEGVNSISVYKRVLKSYLTVAADFYRIISKFYFKRSNYDEALTYGIKEMSIREDFLCENDTVKVDTYRWLGNIYERIGNSLRASRYIDNAYNICKKEFGDKSQTTILMLSIKERITQEIGERRIKNKKQKRNNRIKANNHSSREYSNDA
jgi:hypothetical protein